MHVGCYITAYDDIKRFVAGSPICKTLSEASEFLMACSACAIVLTALMPEGKGYKSFSSTVFLSPDASLAIRRRRVPMTSITRGEIPARLQCHLQNPHYHLCPQWLLQAYMEALHAVFLLALSFGIGGLICGMFTSNFKLRKTLEKKAEP